MNWFSCSARFAVVVGDVGITRMSRSVYVLRAHDFEDAFRRALDRSRREEESYENADGERVSWHLVDIETLDVLGESIEDGREVYSEPLPAPPSAGDGAALDFRPEASEWGHSGV